MVSVNWDREMRALYLLDETWKCDECMRKWEFTPVKHQIEAGPKKTNNNTDKWVISLVCVSWTESKVEKKEQDRFQCKAFYYLQSIG